MHGLAGERHHTHSRLVEQLASLLYNDQHQNNIIIVVEMGWKMYEILFCGGRPGLKLPTV